MKKLLSKWLIITIVLVNSLTNISFASDIESYIGKWSCEVTKFIPIDLDDLRIQIESIMASKIPDDQWAQMKLTLQSAMNSNIKDVNSEKFTLDIFDEYNTGINVELVNNNGSISSSTGASEENGGIVFEMDRFINEYVKADTSMFVQTENGESMIGQTVISQTISSNGMNLKIKSIVDFKGSKIASELIEEEEIIYIDSIEIINEFGNEISSIDLIKNSNTNLKYLIYPLDYTKEEVKKIEWYTNDSSIATINRSGIVTAKADGKTQIVVWINGDYELSDSINIDVSSEDKERLDKEDDSKKDDDSSTSNNVGNKGANEESNKDTVDKVEDVVTDFADIISKATDFLPSPETMGKVPLLDIFVFGYEWDKDTKENVEFGDSKDYAEKKSFWGNVLGVGPIGMIPKAADLVLEVSKKIGFDFDFSFEQTVKGANNFAFDMFSGDSRANIDDMKKRHKENHYGVIGGFGVWVSSTINDFSNRGRELNNEIENN